MFRQAIASLGSSAQNAWVFHYRVKGNDRCSTVAVQPRSSALLDIFVMRFELALMTCGFVIFFVRVDFANAKAHLTFQIDKLLALGGRDHTASAYGGVCTERNRRTNKVSIGLIAAKAIDDRECLVGIGSYMVSREISLPLTKRAEPLVANAISFAR